MSRLFFVLLVVLVSRSYGFVLEPGDVQKAVVENFSLLQEARLKPEESKANLTSATGDFDTKLKVKTSNRIDEKFDYQFIESSVEKQIGGAGLKLFMGYLQGLGRIPAYTGLYETDSAGEGFVGVSVPLLRDRKIDQSRYQLSVAKIENEMASQELELKKSFYIYKALSAYEKWRLAYAKYGLKKKLVDIASDRQTMLEKRVHAGDLENYKLIDNQRSVDKRNEELLAAELELENARVQLSLYMRSKSGEPIDLKQRVPAHFDRRDISKKDFEIEPQALPQAQLIDAEISMNKEVEKLSRNQALPALNLEATTYRRLSGEADGDPTRYQVGLQFEIPVENRKARGKAAASQYKIKALEYKKTYFKSELEAHLEQLFATARLHSERTLIIEREVKRAQFVAEAERKRWKQGEADLFVVALREQEAADAEARLRAAEYEVAQSELDRKLILNQF